MVWVCSALEDYRSDSREARRQIWIGMILLQLYWVFCSRHLSILLFVFWGGHLTCNIVTWLQERVSVYHEKVAHAIDRSTGKLHIDSCSGVFLLFVFLLLLSECFVIYQDVPWFRVYSRTLKLDCFLHTAIHSIFRYTLQFTYYPFVFYSSI